MTEGAGTAKDVDAMVALLEGEGFVPSTSASRTRESGKRPRSIRMLKPGSGLNAVVGPKTTWVYRSKDGEDKTVFQGPTAGVLSACREAVRHASGLPRETEAEGDAEGARGAGARGGREVRSTDRFAEGTDEDRREWALEDKHDFLKEGG